MKPAALPPGAPVVPGMFFGFLIVLATMTASEAGKNSDGTWADVRCVCSKRRRLRVVALRAGSHATCGDEDCSRFWQVVANPRPISRAVRRAARRAARKRWHLKEAV